MNILYKTMWEPMEIIWISTDETETVNADQICYSHLALSNCLQGWLCYRREIQNEIMLSGRQDVFGEERNML